MEANFNVLLVSNHITNSKLEQLNKGECRLIKHLYTRAKDGRIMNELWLSCEKEHLLEVTRNLLLLGAIIRIGTLDGKTYRGHLLPILHTFPNPILKRTIKIQTTKTIQEIEQFITGKIAWKVIYRKRHITLYLSKNITASWFFKKGIRVLEPYYSPPKLLNTKKKNQNT